MLHHLKCPSNYAANYPQGHPRAQQQQSSGQTTDYRRGSNNSVGYSTLPMSMNTNQQQLINNQQPNTNLMQQQPINMVHPISQMNNQLNSSTNNYNPSPQIDLPPPPPLPIHQTPIDTLLLERTSGTISPPLPSPPPNVDEQSMHFNSTTDWIPKEYVEKVISIYDYSANRSDELSFEENSIIYVIKKNGDGWFEGIMNGITGLFPGNYVVAAPQM